MEGTQQRKKEAWAEGTFETVEEIETERGKASRYKFRDKKDADMNLEIRRVQI